MGECNIGDSSSTKRKSPEDRSGPASGREENGLFGSLGGKGGELRLEGPVGFLGSGEIELTDLVDLSEERLISVFGIADQKAVEEIDKIIAETFEDVDLSEWR